MTAEIFIVLFLLLATIDWFMDMVQRTTILICRANSASTSSAGQYMLPTFISISFPITLGKWALAGWFAWSTSPLIGLGILFLSWLFGVLSPIPLRITLPPIQKKISHIEQQDPGLGAQLRQMLSHWQTTGTKF